jgi:hypothetical protein
MKTTLLAALLIAAAWSGPLAADAGVLARAQERAELIAQVKSLLESENPAMRLSIFEEVMRGDDALLRSMAMESALGSGDEQLVTSALRELFDGRSEILVKLVLPERPTQAQQWLYQQWHGLMLSNTKVDRTTDQISTANRKQKGQLVRGGFELRLPGWNHVCIMRGRPVAGTLLGGALECTMNRPAAAENRAGAERESIPFTISLS